MPPKKFSEDGLSDFKKELKARKKGKTKQGDGYAYRVTPIGPSDHKGAIISLRDQIISKYKLSKDRYSSLHRKAMDLLLQKGFMPSEIDVLIQMEELLKKTKKSIKPPEEQ